MKGFSIIVCCHNSSLRIGKTLNYISKLQIPDGYEIEILIIDNLCSDNTVSVVNKEASKLGIANLLKIIFEPIPGLNFARVAGISNSIFDYIIFCDDDNWLFSNYLYLVLDNFRNENIVILGGMGIPVSDIEFPDWFVKFKGYGYAVGDSGFIDGFGQTVYGAGMAIRRSESLKICEIKHNFLLSDRKGNSLNSGGDSEICVLVGLNNVFFDRRMNFYHYLPANRLTFEYYINLNFNFGLSTSKLFFYKLVKHNSNFVAFKIFGFNFLKHFKELLTTFRNSKEDRVLRSFKLGLIIGFFNNFFIFFRLRKKAIFNFSLFRDT